MALKLTDVSDLDVESTRLILNLLSPKDLCCVASTCRYFYRAIFDGSFAERLWKSHCTQLLGSGVVALHKAAIPSGYRAGPIFWRDLWLAGRHLHSVRWWRQGASQLKASVETVDSAKEAAAAEAAAQQADAIAADNADGLGEDRRKAVLAEAEAATAGRSTLKAKLARSGHAANVIGLKVVITGGILRDGSLIVDVITVDLATMSVCRPECEGDAPSTRFRHTTAPINPSPGTPLHDLVSEALGGKQPMSSGQLLLVFGGYNTIGEEFGANSTFVLWAATDGSRYIWREIATQGTPPTPRFHHSCDAYDDGHKAIIFGGEGYMLDDTGESPPPSVYILDVDTLVWTRSITHAPAEEDNPGARSLHVTTIRQSPETGHEELVVVGGYYTSVLAEMKPFTLDLETLVWHCWEGVEPVPTDASGPSQSVAAPAMPKLPGLPEPRQRMAAQRISHDWLLISGGSPASGSFLDDLQQLHVPSLTWKKPPEVAGRPSRALRRIAGHTLAGLLAFGGCIPTIMGIMPVEKLDLLLLGQGTAGLLPTAPEAAETAGQVASASDASAPLWQGSLGVQRSSAALLAAKAERKQKATLRISTKESHLPEVAAKGSSGQKAQEQEQQAVSDPDSPMLDPNKKPGGPVDLETAAHDGVFNQFVADQLLSQGQRINIGSPDTYFRPAYATAAGVKSAPDAEDPSLVRGRLQVINTSLLADEQHIQQMDRQFHPARQGHSQPEPGAGADSLTQPWDASLYPSQSEPGPPGGQAGAAATPSAAELAARLSSMAMTNPAGALPTQPTSSGEIVQYTAEEKGKQKALNQDSYQPVADSQEARELEEGLLLSKLQASGSSTQKSVAAIDPDMPGGPPTSAPTETSLYFSSPQEPHVPGGALEPQSGALYYRTHQDGDGRLSFSTHAARRSTGHPVSAAVPGRLITTAHGSLDSNQMFVVSSVRNDEIAFHGPNPFASDSARPWAGESGMGPYLAAPSMQHPDARLQAKGMPLLASKANAPGRFNGQNTPFSSKQQAKPSLEAQLGFMPHRNLESLQEDAPPLGSSPSAASLSSQSFASALSKDMQAQDAPSEAAGGLPAQELYWFQQNRDPGLVMPPSQAPAPLSQMADTRSIFPQDEPAPLQRALMHPGPCAAAEMPCDKPPYADDRDRPGPFKSPADTAEDPPKTMQLWRDVRTGQLYRLLPSALPVARQSEGELRALQQKPECAGQARSRRSVELESVLSSDDRLWPADPARSLCCIQ